MRLNHVTLEAGIYTETLARLYLKQGFVERALAIYRRLAQEQPDNARLHERLHTWSRRLRAGEELGQNLWCNGVCQTARTRPQRPCYTVKSTILPRSLNAGYTICSASVGSASAT